MEGGIRRKKSKEEGEDLVRKKYEREKENEKKQGSKEQGKQGKEIINDK